MTAVARRLEAFVLILSAGVAALLLAAGTAAARDAHVRSFDGTRIFVHFFAAAGPKAHHRAPTVLKGPGWGQLGSTDQNSRPRPRVG